MFEISYDTKVVVIISINAIMITKCYTLYICANYAFHHDTICKGQHQVVDFLWWRSIWQHYNQVILPRTVHQIKLLRAPRSQAGRKWIRSPAHWKLGSCWGNQSDDVIHSDQPIRWADMAGLLDHSRVALIGINLAHWWMNLLQICLQ